MAKKTVKQSDELMSYEVALAELQEIISLLEQEAIDMDSLSGKVARASFLLGYCQQKLHTIEADVQQLLAPNKL
jgi:exodeoxyribonuclease VII small subunit